MVLTYTAAFSRDCDSYRKMAHMLASSWCRSHTAGDFFVFLDNNDPIFRVLRVGVEEIPIDDNAIERGAPWFCASEMLTKEDLEEYSAVLFMDADCLILRNIDHLFVGDDWDILYQPEVQSNPHVNAGIGAVKPSIYHDVMSCWRELMSEASASCSDSAAARSTWNQLVLTAEQHGWRTKRFESHEIQFPLLSDLDWNKYKNAAIIHCAGCDNWEKHKFMFGVYMQTFFHDSNGTVSTLLDM